MYRKPIVHLFVTRRVKEGDEVRLEMSLLTYNGKSIASEYLVSFKYTYTSMLKDDDKGDHGSLVLAFPHGDVDLLGLGRGTEIYLEWGYAGERVANVTVVIDDLKISYNSSGFIVTLDFISYAEFADKQSDFANSLIERAGEINVKFEFSLTDPLSKETQVLVIDPETREASLNQWSTLSDFIKFGRDRYEDLVSLPDEQLILPPTGSGSIGHWGWLTGTGDSRLSSPKATPSEETLMTLLLKWARGISPFLVASMSGDKMGLSSMDETDKIHYSISTQGPSDFKVISIVIEKTNKTHDDEDLEGMDVIVMDGSARSLIVDSTVASLGLSIKYQMEGLEKSTIYRVVKSGSRILLEDLDSKALVTPDDKFTKQIQYHLYIMEEFGREAFEDDWELKEEFRDPVKVEGRIRARRAGKVMDFLNPSGFSEEDFKTHIKSRAIISGHPHEAREIRNGFLSSFYYQMMVDITLEGTTVPEVRKNFNISGVSNVLDGTYFAVTVEHNISISGYTTSMTGTRIPGNIQALNMVEERDGHGEYKKLVEQELLYWRPAAFDTFRDLSLIPMAAIYRPQWVIGSEHAPTPYSRSSRRAVKQLIHPSDPNFLVKLNRDRIKFDWLADPAHEADWEFRDAASGVEIEGEGEGLSVRLDPFRREIGRRGSLHSGRNISIIRLNPTEIGTQRVNPGDPTSNLNSTLEDLFPQ